MAIEVTSVHERRRTRVIKSVGRVMKAGARAAALRKRRIIIRSVIASLIIACVACLALLVYSYISYSKIVDERLANGYLTSRAGIYAAPRTLREGQSITPDNLVELLRRAGYVESSASDVWSGSFIQEGNRVLIRPRHLGGESRFPSLVSARFDNRGRLFELKGDDVPLDAYTLEPELLTNDASLKGGKRAALSYQDLPPVLVHAILSIEDRRFFEHSGVDIFGVVRALLRNAGDNEIGQGGSTITQQLVKNTYLSPERTFRRKYAEAMLAFTLERRLSKEDIFALYCNEVYLGQRGAVGVRGVEQAARVYFGKDLKDLTLAESATIAGMIQSPNRYAPDRHADAAVARRNTVLGVMVRDGFITLEQAGTASKEQLAVVPYADQNGTLAPYFVDYVNRVTESQLAQGSEGDERSLRIYTTIDLELQQLAEVAVKRQLERLDKVYKGKQTPQAALVALDPKTGAVLAMVGGRDYADSQLNRASDARRQPGSTFKPFVYAAALESGLSPVSMYTDAPREFQYDKRAVYRPANYGGAYSMRDVMMRTGLVKSLNVVTVDVAMRTGLGRVARVAESFGLKRPEPYPALALGTTEATPVEMAAAYAVFANGGKRIRPTVIARATDAGGGEIIDNSTLMPAAQVIQPTTAYMITDMLGDVIDHGTARAARGAVRKTAIAGKTGTSRDGWFVGYTPNMVVAVWIGFDDNKQLGLTGAEAALPAWTEFVKNAVELRPDLGGERFARPAGITTVEIDPETGMLATSSCPQRESIALTSALAPRAECLMHNPLLELAAMPDANNGYYEPNSINTASAQNAQPPAYRPATIEEMQRTAKRTRVETNTRGESRLTNEMRVRVYKSP